MLDGDLEYSLELSLVFDGDKMSLLFRFKNRSFDLVLL